MTSVFVMLDPSVLYRVLLGLNAMGPGRRYSDVGVVFAQAASAP